MSSLERDIQKLVNDAVEKSKPKREENFLNKKEARKLLKQFAQQEFFNKTEAANYLGMSLSTFWHVRQNHDIKVYVIDGLPRFKKTDLDKFMEEKSVKGYA